MIDPAVPKDIILILFYLIVQTAELSFAPCIIIYVDSQSLRTGVDNLSINCYTEFYVYKERKDYYERKLFP